MKVAVVGATGLVGRKILQLLTERQFPADKILPVASKKSIGKKIEFNNQLLNVIGIEDAIKQRPKIAIFSAGSEVSLKYAPKFKAVGSTVIDNSSAWRMHPGHKLIIPEINAKILKKTDKIIANPNCSTIQMLMVLAPLHQKYKIKRIVVATYQSVSGTGNKALKQLYNERANISGTKIYPHQIDLNCIPQCDDFTENGYTKEELKLIYETQKILNDSSIKITATAVRIPVVGGHSEAVNVEFENDFELSEIYTLLNNTQGVIVQDNIDTNIYPMPIHSHEKDEVFVGRIRRDFSNKKTLNLWITADNIRKGAATNAIQIAEYLWQKNLL